MDIDKKNDKNTTEIKKLKTQIASLKKNKLFGLVWEEKEEDVVSFSKENIPVLRENQKNEIIHSLKESNYQYIIEGDNYPALSALNISHTKKFDVIYIDPPYNTGNKDFIFNDKIVEPDDSFRHSKWLSFMHSRLTTAKNLLAKGGLIFISIDDNEQAQLTQLADEVFGTSKKVGPLIWFYEGVNDNAAFIKKTHEYILCYSVDDNPSLSNELIDNNVKLSDNIENSVVKNGPKNPKSTILLPKGFPAEIKNGVIKKKDINSLEVDKDIKIKNFKLVEEVSITSGWSSRDILEEFINYNFKPVLDSKNQTTTFIIKKSGNISYTKVRSTSHIISVLRNLGTTQNSSEELKQMGLNFSFPKPKGLIKYLLQFHSNKNAVVLDFFAGSGTTGHAVLELNKEDGGNRQFILVTNNENNIAEEVTYPRLRNVINGYKNLKNEKIDGLGGNLKYYEIDFVPADNSDPSMYELAINLVDTLCLKENTFTEHHTSKDIKIFKNNEDHYCCIVFDEDKIDLALQKLNNTDGSYSFYIYSLGGEIFDEELEDFISEHPNTISTPFPLTMKNIYKSLK